MSNEEGRVRPCAGCPSAWRLGKLCTSDASFDKVRRWRRRRGRTLARFPLGNRGQPGAPPATATATSHGQQTKAILQDLIICSRQQQLCSAVPWFTWPALKLSFQVGPGDTEQSLPASHR